MAVNKIDQISFATEFWNSTPGVSSGHSILLEKMRLSATVNERYSDFLKSLSSSCDAFSKSLVKVAKTNPFEEETGQLAIIGKLIQDMIKKMSNDVQTTATRLVECFNTSMKECVALNEERKQIKDNLRDYRNKIADQYKTVIAQQKQAKQRCEERNESERIVNAMKNDGEKDRLKARLNAKKSSDIFIEAEKAYETSVATYNKLLNKAKFDVTEECKKIQNLELARGYQHRQIFKHVLKTFEILVSSMKNNILSLSSSMNKYDEVSDLISWTANNRTAQDPPSRLKYIPSDSK